MHWPTEKCSIVQEANTPRPAGHIYLCIYATKYVQKLLATHANSISTEFIFYIVRCWRCHCMNKKTNTHISHAEYCEAEQTEKKEKYKIEHTKAKDVRRNNIEKRN